MTRNPIHRASLVILSVWFAVPLPAVAADAELREQLRDALFTEEVTRDPEAAAKQYEALLAGYDGQRTFAASALFRLAEVRRKQDRKDEAIALYQRLLREFPQAAAEVKLARENLLGLGAEPVENPAGGEGDRELRKLRDWIASSPDRLKDPELLLTEIREGRLASIDFLLKAGAAGEPWKLLNQAVETGNLRTITLLLDHPFKSGVLDLDGALFLAITKEYRDVTLLLLARGADPNAQGVYRVSENVDPPTKTLAMMTSLHVAVRKRDVELCKVLLDHKADPNRLAEYLEGREFQKVTMPGYPLGTPLHDAVVCSLEITRLLLERGADVKAASPQTGFTPLHSAVRPSHLVGDKQGPEILKLLIEKGADLNAMTSGPIQKETADSRRSRVPVPSASTQAASPGGVTPLKIALTWGNPIAARGLIEAGAATSDPDLLGRVLASGNLELVRLLLAANPKSVIPPDALADAVGRKSEEMIRLLVAAGADLSAPGPRENLTPLQVAAAMEGPPELLQLLIDLGAKASADWIARDFEGASYWHRPFLYRQFLVPRLFERPAISLIIPELGPIPPVELATDQGESPLPLALLLLKQQIRWPVFGGEEMKGMPMVLTLSRKSATKTETFTIRLKDDAALPELKWGDVLELAPDWDALGGRKSYSNIEYRDKMPARLRWDLMRRVAFPVVVEIDGKERSLTLRGDRLIFDPGSDQVPLLRAARLGRLLWTPEINPGGGTPALSVVRKGWPSIEVAWDQTMQPDFPLEPGDRLVIKTPAVEDELEARKRSIAVVGAGVPFARYFHVAEETGPTLIQALAEITCGWMEPLATQATAPSDLVDLVADHSERWGPLRLLPHPDLSKISIRRLREDGTETRIAVDLTAAIAAAGQEASPETARASDVALVAGDIVEIPQLEGMAGKPWRGPSAEEAGFFAKALDCRIHVRSSSGIEPRKIRYAAPRFVEVAGQWIPTKPEEGASSLTVASVLGERRPEVRITRQGSDQKETHSAAGGFLREGDVVELGSVPPPPRVVPPPAPAATRQARPRVIPPPSLNR